MIELGEKVKCIVSGLTGIVISRLEYMNGCVQYCVKPKVGKDGKEVDGIYIDEGQLKVVTGGILKKKKAPRRTGGAMNDTPKANYPG